MFPLEIQNYAPSLKVLRKRVRQKKLFMESVRYLSKMLILSIFLLVETFKYHERCDFRLGK